MNNATLRKALAKYGATAQEDIVIEEMSELTKAILKHRRAGKFGQYDLSETINAVAEEIADVEIGLEYLKLINEMYSPGFRQAVDGIKQYKLRRLAERVEGEENG